MKSSIQKTIFIFIAASAFAALGCSRNFDSSPPPDETASAPAPAAAAPAPAAAATSTAKGEMITGPGIRFTAPGDWTVQTPTSSMRRAQYSLAKVGGDPEDAQLVVFFFAGAGGTVQDNIQRWIGQFKNPDGSPAKDVAETRDRKVNGLDVTVLDVSGTFLESSGPMMGTKTEKPGFRMLGAVAETGQGPWFFKLTGPKNTVDKWEESFFAFVQSFQPGP